MESFDLLVASSPMELVRQAYGILAVQYIELFGSSAQVHPDDLALITRHLSIRPGTVLDVGCGPGHLPEHLRSLDVDATGIDVVPAFIDHARAAYPVGRYGLGSMHQLRAHLARSARLDLFSTGDMHCAFYIWLPHGGSGGLDVRWVCRVRVGVGWWASSEFSDPFLGPLDVAVIFR